MTLIQLPLHVLCRVLTGLASDPVSILAFGFTCRRAYDVASDEQLVWKPLCIALGWGIAPTKGDATPEAWGAISFKHLVLALVHPCTPLLGDWTSPDVFPTGRLLRVEARPPQVLGVSLYYRTLNGPPNCHAVFHIRLPEQQQGAPPVKAVVSCLKRSQQHAGSSSADDSHPASLVLRSDRRSFHLRCAVSCNAGLCEAICRHSYAQAYDPAVGPVLALPSSTRSGSASASASSSGPTTPAAAAAGAEGPPAAAAAASSHSWTSCSDQGEEWPEINVRPWDAGLVQMGSILALSSTLSHRQCVPVYSRLHWQQHVGEGAGVAGGGVPPPAAAAAAGDGCGLDFTTTAASAPMAAGLPVVNGHTTAAASASASHAAELLLPPDVLLLQGMWRGTYGCHGVELISVSLLQLGHDIDEPPPAKPQPPELQEEQPSLSPGTAAGAVAQGAPWSVVSAPLVRAGGPWQPGEAPQGGHAGGPMQGSWPGAPWGMEPPGWGGSSSSGRHAAPGAPPQAEPAAAAAAGDWPAALQPQQHTWSPGASVSPLSSPNLPWVLAPPGLQLSAQQQQQQQLGSLAGSGSSVLHEEDMDSEEQELLQMALPSNDYDSEPDSLSDIEDAESGGVVLYEPTLSSESDSEDGYLLDQAGSGVSLGGPGGASAAAAGGVVLPTAQAAAGGAGGGPGGVGASATGSGVTGSGAPGAASSGGSAPAEATMTGWGSSMTRSFSGVLLADAFGASARPGPLLWHPTAAAAAAAARAPQSHPHALPAHARSRLAVMTSGPPFTPGVVLLAPSTEGSSGSSSSSEAPGASGLSHSSPLGQASSQVEQGVLPYSSMYGTAASSDAALHALRTRSEVPPVRATAADVLLRQLRGSSYAAGVAALPHQQAAGSVGSSSVSGVDKAAAAAGFTRLSAPAAGWSPAAAGADAWGAAAGAGPNNLQQPAMVHNLAAPTGAGAADQLMQLFQRQQQQQAQLAEAAMEPGLASAQLAALRLSPGPGSQHAAAAAGGGGAGDLTAAHLAATSLPSSSAPVAPAAPLQSHQHHQQQQEQEADLGQTFWYAVGRKVTGDLNVPAGKVSFVVDISSRSTEHAGEVLALKLGYDTDVALHKAGTRRLVERVRYQGRAQLAFHGFERPSVIGAELLLFDDDCFGLMWHGPVQSLSLYVRVRQP